MDPEARGNALLAVELVKEGIAAAKAGQTEEAREILVRAVALDERNLQGWLWLSGVVESLDDKEVCLENVLILDPTHAAARQGLEFVRRQMPAADGPEAKLETSAPAVLIDNGDISEEDVISPTLAPAAASEQGIGESIFPEGTPSKDAWENEFLCPYCATPTDPDDRSCPSCHQKLSLKVRRREKMSGWLRFVIIVQAFSTVGLLIGPLLLLVTAAEAVNVVNPFTLLPQYAGFTDPASMAMMEEAMAQVSRVLMIVAFIPFVFSVLMLIGLLQRWRFIYYLMLIGSILSLLTSVIGIFLMGRPGIIPGIIGVAYGLFVVFVVFQMEDDFLFDERRIVMRIDPSAKNGMDFLTVGRNYMQQRMWGLAVVHLRRAAGRMPEMIDAHLALAASLMNLKHYDEAARSLGDARRVNPEHPGLQELQTTWEELTARA